MSRRQRRGGGRLIEKRDAGVHQLAFCRVDETPKTNHRCFEIAFAVSKLIHSERMRFSTELMRHASNGMQVLPVAVWDGEIWDIATVGHEAFNGLGRVEKSFAQQLWVWRNRPPKDFPCSVPGYVLQAVIVTPGGALCAFAGEECHENHLVRPLFVEIADTAPEFNALVAAMQFQKLPFVHTREIELSSQYREVVQAAGFELPSIRSILLRRSKKEFDADSCESVKWACRWLVSGHWRRLKEPRKSDGARITYITPYLKGPENKPLRSPRPSLYVVVR